MGCKNKVEYKKSAVSGPHYGKHTKQTQLFTNLLENIKS